MSRGNNFGITQTCHNSAKEKKLAQTRRKTERAHGGHGKVTFQCGGGPLLGRGRKRHEGIGAEIPIPVLGIEELEGK